VKKHDCDMEVSRAEKISRAKRLDFNVVKARVEGMGHTLLSEAYLNNQQKLSLICSCGNPWSATLQDILRGSTCHGRAPKVTMAQAVQIAKERGGRCLSLEIANTKTPLMWSCSNNHLFAASYDSIRGTKHRRGTWCPQCSNYVTQELCRTIIQKASGVAFPECRPTWLSYDEGGKSIRLSLDGFSENLGIAWEYQGHFHYQQHPKSTSSLETRQQYDKAKPEICAARGIKLAVIELIPPNVGLGQIVTAINQAFMRVGIAFPDVAVDTIDANGAYSGSRVLRLLETIAKEKEGRFLSQSYIGIDRKYSFECKNGHQFSATAASVIHGGSWCPCRECAGLEPFTMAELSRFYAAKGFALISTAYKNVDSEITVRCCVCGEVFSGRHRNHRYNGIACPGVCSIGRTRKTRPHKYDFATFQSRVLKNGDELLARDYTGLTSRYPVKCLACNKVRSISGIAIDKGGGCSCRKGARIAAAKKRSKGVPVSRLS
jgi:hypothetical protein